jgi:outer membrane protein assembly factor BamD
MHVLSSPPIRRWLLPALLAASLVATGGCKTLGWGADTDEEIAKGSPEEIYREARDSLRSGSFDRAIQHYELLEARFPFSEQAKQGQLDLLYAYYKNRAPESAVDQADQFIRENPAHPRVDYAYYIRGLVYFESGANFVERLFHAEISKRPPQDARKSFQSFQTLVQQFPKSPYAADARQRMVYLRNRMADYEISVAQYYVKRGAYVGAANRAKGVIENYDGAPAVDDALAIMAKSYRKLGLDDLAKSADTVRAANPKGRENMTPADAAAATAMMASSERPPVSGAPRKGRWEAFGGVQSQGGTDVTAKGGTTADFSSSATFLIGVGYNFTERLELAAMLGFDQKDYTAQIAGDTPGETFPVKGSMDTFSLMLDGTFNIMHAGRWTPYVMGGVGWTKVDTNIATAPPDVGCWWDPWYGYVCASFQDTKNLNGLAYQVGLGVRYEINPAFDVRGSYQMSWQDLGDQIDGTDFDGFQVLFGWKF